MRMRPIALMTDFGLDDPFVGLMRAVIARFAPSALVFDLTHGIAPQAIADGAFWLGAALAYLPDDVVCLAVVDPGVGTSRSPLVVRHAGRFFVGPDNGLLTAALELGEARAIDVARHGLANPSATFHGRDVFAPVAAKLAAGTLAFEDVGPALERAALVRMEDPRPTIAGDEVHGEITRFDRYGNAFTNLEGTPSDVTCAGTRFARVSTYAAASEGAAICLVNAFGVIELAVRNGSARERFGLARGDRVSGQMRSR